MELRSHFSHPLMSSRTACCAAQPPLTPCHASFSEATSGTCCKCLTCPAALQSPRRRPRAAPAGSWRHAWIWDNRPNGAHVGHPISSSLDKGAAAAATPACGRCWARPHSPRPSCGARCRRSRRCCSRWQTGPRAAGRQTCSSAPPRPAAPGHLCGSRRLFSARQLGGMLWCSSAAALLQRARAITLSH